MSDFKTVGDIKLRSGDEISYTFKITSCSTATANDGFLPYGRTISDVTVVAYNTDGTAVTSALIEGTPSLVSNTVTCVLKYPVTDGRYTLKFSLLLDNSETKDAYFKRVRAESVI